MPPDKVRPESGNRRVIGRQRASNVVNLHGHAGYKPDLATLARAQVSSARERLGLTHDEFAELLAPLLGWTPSAEVVESWETAVVPPGDVVLAAGMTAQDTSHNILAVALNSDAERVLSLLSSAIGDLDRIAGSPDVVRAYAMRGLIARPEWNNMIRGAKRHLWLYGMAELGYALDDEVPTITASASNDDCDVRILLLNPEYEGIPDIDVHEGSPPGTLAARIRSSLARFAQMQERCDGRMKIRLYNAPPTVSIVRGDDRMLITPYLRFFIGSNSPTFELRHTPEGNIFERYARHFETMWNLAEEWNHAA
jgi:hypothetical protein